MLHNLAGKSELSNFSQKQLYVGLYLNFRVEELKFVLEKIGYSQKEFLSRLGKKTYSTISRIAGINKNELSSAKTCIRSKWVDFLRNEIGDERLLILRELFQESVVCKKMKKNDRIIDEKLLQGRKIEDYYDE